MTSVNYAKIVLVMVMAFATFSLAFIKEITEVFQMSEQMTFLFWISGVCLVASGLISLYKAKEEHFERMENKFLLVTGFAQLLVGLSTFTLLIQQAREISSVFKLGGAGIALLAFFGAMLWSVWEYRWR